MSKIDRCVVRNQAYQRKSVVIRERHNERKNESYANSDVISTRSHMNVHFKACESTYTEAFDKMLEGGVISTRGLKQDAKIIDEFVFDVNSYYFERNGGYEYAKKFFEEAYRMAVNEVGGEQFILSAVMHADERNKALSEQLGRDIYHYHLHVVYVPVVIKEVKWTKRCKDPALVGTTKEVIHQVSHSKKWASEKATDENGKTVLVKSYSLLQDRFFEHMQAAGYTDFERGERGSTTEHLSVLDYKIKQDKAKAAELDENIQSKQQQAATLDKKVEKQEQHLSSVQEKISIAKQSAVTFQEIDDMAKSTFFNKKAVELSQADWKTVSSLAKQGVTSNGIISDLKRQLADEKKKVQEVKQSYSRLHEDTKEYREAKKSFPQKVKDFISELLEQKEIEPKEEKTKSHFNFVNLEI